MIPATRTDTMPEDDSSNPETTPASDPEREIERVLAEAAGLTEVLVDEIGFSTDADGEPVDAPLPSPEEEAAAVAELDEVAAVLADVARLGDEESAEPPPADASQPESQSPYSADSEVGEPPPEREGPLREESATDSDADAAPSDGETQDGSDVPHPAAVAPSTDVPTTDVRETPDVPVPKRRPAPRDKFTADKAEAGTPTTATKPGLVDRVRTWVGQSRDLVRRAIAQVAPLAQRTVEISLAGLDMCDTKFTWVGYDIRRILGWVALAMLAASSAIIAHSLA